MKLIKNNIIYETQNELTINQMLKYGAKIYNDKPKQTNTKPIKRTKRKK